MEVHHTHSFISLMYPSFRVNTMSCTAKTSAQDVHVKRPQPLPGISCGLAYLFFHLGLVKHHFNWLSAAACSCLTPKVSYLKVRGRL